MLGASSLEEEERGPLPLTSLSIPQGQGALSSVESTSVEGAARVWAGVWGLLCLGFCSPSGCLGACHSGPSVPLLGSVEAPPWVVSTAQGTVLGIDSGPVPALEDIPSKQGSGTQDVNFGRWPASLCFP